MKKTLSLILCFVMVLALFAGCAGGDTKTEKPSVSEAIANKDGVLKILALGNSFSEDAMQMLYEIAQSEGKEQIVLGNLVIGGCNLTTHAGNTLSNAPAYAYKKNTDGAWTTKMEVTMLEGICDEDWDVITLQQSSDGSGKVGTYNHDIQLIVNYVNEHKTNPDGIMLWHMTWAYPTPEAPEPYKYFVDQAAMYAGITGAVQEKIVTDAAFTGVLPSGTAIQNARSSYLGDTLNRDGSHLNDLGRVIAGYTWYCMLTGKTLDTIGLNAVPEKLTKSYEEGGDMVLTEGEKLVIAEAVKNAIANPYAVTQSQYTEDPGK